LADHFLKTGSETVEVQQTKPKADGGFTEVLKIFVSAFFIAFLIRSFAYEPFSIPSGSMEPTLQIGDTLFVSKFAYGYGPYSIPFIKLPFDGRIGGTGPERGDIVVFKLPTDTSTDYIKRVIGLPGDQVQVVDGRLYINDKLVERDFKADVLEFNSGIRLPRKLYHETLPNGVVHEIYEENDNQPLDDTRVFKVPEGNYFMMGDNRDGSQDSRVILKVGYVPAENIVGRAERIFYSVKPGEPWWQFWRWGEVMRLDRTFRSVDTVPDK